MSQASLVTTRGVMIHHGSCSTCQSVWSSKQLGEPSGVGISKLVARASWTLCADALFRCEVISELFMDFFLSLATESIEFIPQGRVKTKNPTWLVARPAQKQRHHEFLFRSLRVIDFLAELSSHGIHHHEKPTHFGGKCLELFFSTTSQAKSKSKQGRCKMISQLAGWPLEVN